MDSLQAGRLDAPAYPFTIRLVFRYEDGRVQVVSQRRVEMIAPASAAPRPEPGKHIGFWVEVRDSRDNVVFHRVLHNPIPFMVERYSADGSIRATEQDVARAEFEVLVPDIPGAATIVLYSSPLELQRTQEPAREIGRFPLDQRRPPPEQ